MEAVVVTSCTNRKRLSPGPGLRARELATGALEDVVQDWLSRLDAAEARVPACRLYCGRAFAESVWTARAIGAPLFIVSAGLGIVAQATQVPSYSLTVAPHSSDGILERAQPASVSDWWRQISARSAVSERLTGIV
jgi:hypothetical protein